MLGCVIWDCRYCRWPSPRGHGVAWCDNACNLHTHQTIIPSRIICINCMVKISRIAVLFLWITCGSNFHSSTV